MIDSQSKLPAQARELAALWAKGRQVVASVAVPAIGRLRALPGIWPVERRRLGLSNVKPDSYYRFIRWLRTASGDGPLLGRFALHLVVVLLAAAVVTVAHFGIPQIDFQLPTPTPAPDLGTRAVVTSPTNRGAGRSVSSSTVLFPAPVPHTTIPERDRMQVITYTVQPNDNVWVIAQSFGLEAQTVLWANPELEQAPDLLSVGQVLTILPVNGVYHTVQSGDTVEKLAKKYESTADKIVQFAFNGLEEPYALTPGQQLIIPDGVKPLPKFQNIYPMTWVGTPPKNAKQGSGRFAWPARGVLSQGYWSGHEAIDIANRTGTPIYAADAGYVRMAGRDTWGYGNQVVIDHGNGFLTRYAHLDTILVKAGQSVTKNQQIGTMGNTGRSTGPHLHFEIIQGNVRRNPLGFLP